MTIKPFKPTAAQITALRMIEKRNWPTGEPRVGWIAKGTYGVLLREGLVAERPDTASRWNGNIIDLTDAGRAALAQASTSVQPAA